MLQFQKNDLKYNKSKEERKNEFNLKHIVEKFIFKN